jgi:amino acid adenylation domain-containing protein
LLADRDCGAVVFDGADPATRAADVCELAGEVPRCDLDMAVPGAPRHPPLVAVPAASRAYVIATSGSTGAPKAVVVSRAALANFVAAHRIEFARLGESDGDTGVVLVALRLTWDGALVLTWWALCTGRTVVFPDGPALSNVDSVIALASRWSVTNAGFTPSFYRLVLPGIAALGRHLRLVFLGGEAVPVPLVEQHHAVLPETGLYNGYGPTEVTLSCVGHPVVEVPDGVVPIGRATQGTVAYVLDDRLRPTTPGVIGELYLGGRQVADGYQSRQAATANRFVADPFAATPGARMYRTGDLVRLDTAGNLEFHGRVDDQLKVRGVRVARHAVAAVVEHHPAVRQAVVLGQPNEHGETVLVAFWSAARTAGVLPTTRELFDFCAARMVDQSVPEIFVPIGTFPLAVSGKVDETALRALVPPANTADGERAGSRWTEVQRSVARLWAEVLRHDDFGLRERFFDVGGNSRRVVELHLRFERTWPGAVRVGQMFDVDTVEAQAQVIANIHSGRSAVGG